MAAKKQSSGELSTAKRNSLSKGAFAFPAERKEPLNNASHVRNAIARFDQVKGVSTAEKKAAFKRIEAAAKKFDVDMTPTSAKELGKKGPTQPAAKKTAAKKTAAKKSAAKKKPAGKSAGSKPAAKKSASKKPPKAKKS